MTRIGLILIVPLVLALAACGDPAGPPTSSAGSSNSASATPSATATPTPTPVPVVPTEVNAADYLIDGNIGTGDDVWGATLGFFTDSSKSVNCDLFVNSETPGHVICEVVLGHESAATYAKPASVVNPCGDGLDGYSVKLGAFQSTGQNVDFDGCRDLETQKPAAFAATKVIPDGGILTFDHYSCAVIGGVATCTDSRNGNYFVFGLSVATLVN